MDSFIDVNLNTIYTDSWTYENTQYPASIFSLWDNQDLASVGVYRVVYDNTPPPEGKYVSGFTYEIVGDYATATPTYTDIPIVVPEKVSKAQGKAALLLVGLLSGVEAYIAGLEGDEKILAEIAFNDTTEWRRDSEFLNKAALAMGLSSEDLDNLFIAAEKINL